MADYQGRVLTEKRELDAKHGKLAEFIGGHIYPTLDETDRDLLIEQLDAMKQYSDVLGQRIARRVA
jgi:hypothetical protein